MVPGSIIGKAWLSIMAAPALCFGANCFELSDSQFPSLLEGKEKPSASISLQQDERS